MNSDVLRQFIEAGENESVDFKQSYHDDNSKLLHDILCLANAPVNARKDRMIIFGVSDNGGINGIQSDVNRKDEAKIYDFLSKVNLNRVPSIRLQTLGLSECVEIDILTIEDLPMKPYFLKKDYPLKKAATNTVLRAGVIYSRRGSKNTSISNEAVDDHELENMFAERLGLNLPAIDRLKDYLKHPDSWEKFYDDLDECYYYSVRPEFYFIIKKSDREVDLSNEPWADPIIFGEAVRYTCILKYHTTAIGRLEILQTTNGNYSMCWPKRDDNGQYFFEKSSIKYILSCFLRTKSMRGSTYDFEKLRISVKD